MAKRENIVIGQGDDVRIQFSEVDELADGDTVRALLCQFEGGPVMATFLCSANVAEKRIVIALPRSVSTQLKRSGVYDVELDGELGIRTVRWGPAILRAQVTTGAAADVGLNYGTLQNIGYADVVGAYNGELG